jgi:hypothetical protein
MTWILGIPGLRGVRGQRESRRGGLRPGGGGSDGDSLARAVRLYYAVRDDIVYTPYCDFTDVETFRASACSSAAPASAWARRRS